MNQELFRIVDGLARDKNIDRETVLEDLEAAILSAIRKKNPTTEDVTVRIDRQTGERTGQDVSAFLLGARAGRGFADGRAGVTLWLDYLSGTEPGSDEVGVFETLFATNHKFYGFMDRFLAIPAHTRGGGLVDLAIKNGLGHSSDPIRGDAGGVGVQRYHGAGIQIQCCL